MGEVLIKAFKLLPWFLLFVSSAQAFTLISPGITGYSDATVSIHINTGCPASVSPVLDAAIEFWNAAPHSGLVLEKGANANVSQADAIAGNFSETILLYCSSDFATDAGGSDPDLIGGVGFAVDADSDGDLDVGRLIINNNTGAAASFGSASSSTREFVMIHEIGHALGLGHSSEQGAIMYFSLNGKEEVNLHQDDIDGLRHLYAQDELSGDYFLGCARVNWTNYNSHGKPIGLLWFLLALPLLMIVRLRNLSKTNSQSF